ncbi:MAG: hypothetical protein CVV44_08695 [Spirochaetae bacterium HGW-Spirochaetae-1]|jgi:AraC-like DNA-binding protein|nr:MAG: hypothetical protein CVV44_08695 [Spirochaetae bacterium HGW-Spirochaetae-1]
MLLRLYKPSPPLAPFIESYIVFEDDGSLKDLPMNIVPNGLPEIAVHYGDHCESHINYPGEVKGGYLYGPHNRPGFFRPRGRIKCLCVLFKPYGVFKIFGHPQVEFRNLAVNLEDICGIDGTDVIEKVALAKTPEEKALAMDSFLSCQYIKAVERSTDIDRELVYIILTKGAVKIRDICKRMDVNIKTLERRFKYTLGLTPKEFATIIRINHAYRLLKTNDSNDIQDVVFECGYYDQSHFINDFKNLTRFTPDVLMKTSDAHVIYLNRIYTY